MVPKIIHQIWIGKDKIPDYCKELSEEMQSMHPDWEYKLWGNEVFEELYPNDKYLNHYLTNTNLYKWAFIADRVRMLLLRDYGGIYCDLDSKPIRSFDIVLNKLHKEHTFFGGVRPMRENNNMPPLIDVTVLGSEPQSRIVNYILSLYKDVNTVWMGKTISDKIWDAIDLDVALFNYEYFYDDKLTDNTIILHDIPKQRLWSWNNGKHIDL